MEKTSFYEQISKNKRNSILLILFVFLILSAFVYIISQLFDPTTGLLFMIIALVVILIHTYVSYQYGDRIVLASVNAKPANEREHAYLINTVEGLAIAAGIPTPKVYIIESDEMNAFATGKDPQHASVAVTTALLKNLNRLELEGVIGHELSHVKNYDIRFATLVAVLVGLIAIVSELFIRSWRFRTMGGRGDRDRSGGYMVILVLVGFLLAILAPIITRLVQAAISRRREFLADASGAQLTRYPEGLANALEKISKVNAGKMLASEAVSHLFFVDPLKSPLDSLFATHPPIKERVKILRAM